MATGGWRRGAFASPVNRDGIDGRRVRVTLCCEVTLDVVMVRGGEQIHRGFERELLRGLVEDNGVHQDVVHVVRDIAGEGFQIMLRVSIMFLHGYGLITFAVLSEQGLARALVSQKPSGWAGDAGAGLARLGGTLFRYAMQFVRR